MVHTCEFCANPILLFSKAVACASKLAKLVSAALSELVAAVDRIGRPAGCYSICMNEAADCIVLTDKFELSQCDDAGL
jgi:hypothetical protein